MLKAVLAAPLLLPGMLSDRLEVASDPAGRFFVHHGVGSEAWSADGFAWLEGEGA